jgi:hypothetical protein
MNLSHWRTCDIGTVIEGWTDMKQSEGLDVFERGDADNSVQHNSVHCNCLLTR